MLRTFQVPLGYFAYSAIRQPHQLPCFSVIPTASDSFKVLTISSYIDWLVDHDLSIYRRFAIVIIDFNLPKVVGAQLEELLPTKYATPTFSRCPLVQSGLVFHGFAFMWA